MEAAQLVRAARRRAGLSQRELARLAGVTARSIASIESGRQQPTSGVLDRLLEAGGLDVALCPRQEPVDSAKLRAHLRLSLTQRLRLALGEAPSIYARAKTPAWHELGALSWCGHVVLERPLAPALWIPSGLVTPVRVSVHAHARLPAVKAVEAVLRETPPPTSLIPVALDGRRQVWVSPPAELALPDHQTTMLLQATQLLEADAARDDARRRRPAHRDPDERDEDRRLLVTKSVVHPPDLRDGRAWRLGAAASLAQRLRER